MNLISTFKNAAGNALKATGRFVVKQHNKIQFVGYEAANVVLAVTKGAGNYGMNFETAAAASFMIGSGAIWFFDFDKRPSAILYGGLGLTAGGLCLAAAGYPLAGLPVALASMETARGGLNVLKDHIEAKKSDPEAVSTINKMSYAFWNKALRPYTSPVEYTSSKLRSFGKFINERPFLTGSIIKFPGRVAFIGQKALERDWIGAGVGVSWLVLGDGGLTLLDNKVRGWIEDKCKKDDPDQKSQDLAGPNTPAAP